MKTLTLILLCLALAAQAQNSLQLVWTGTGEAPYNYYGGGITSGDFNADGLCDVLIGAWGWGNVGGNDAIGKNYLYLGSPQFLDSASFFFLGDTADDGYDYAICNVGDVSADQIEDFLIPAAGAWGGGYAEVHFGGAALDTIADWRVKKSSPIFWGDMFGIWADSAGDVNGDGWCDFVISGGGDQSGSTYFEIYFGGPSLDTVADWRYTTTLYTGYNHEVKGLGDVNGDGYDDLLAYKPVASSGPTYPGQIFLGGAQMDTIPDLEFWPYLAAGGGIGDVNNDGYADFAVYKPFSAAPDDRGSIVFLGSSELDTVAEDTLEGVYSPYIKALDGFSHADVNGDGISDIVCSGGWDFPYIYVYLGSRWFNRVPDWWYSEGYAQDGITPKGLGDINGDGCDDIAFGMPHYDFDKGRVRVFAGNDTLTDQGAGVEPEELRHYPGWFKLEQNYPNPFNSSTSIHFEIGKPSNVNLRICDIRGAAIKQLVVSKPMSPGGYNVSWNAKNEQNQQVSSGIYLLELQVDQYRQLRKIALLR